MYGDYFDQETKKIDEAIRYLESREPGIMKTISTELSRSDKMSVSDSDAKYTRFKTASAAAKDRVLVSRNLADVSSWMEGSVILNYLTQKAGAIPYIIAELEYRGVEYYLDPEKIEEHLTMKDLKRHQTKRWDKQSIAWLKKALKIEEHKRLSDEAREANVHPPKLNEVKNCKPLSDKLKEWLPKQWAIYKEKKGQVHEAGNDD